MRGHNAGDKLPPTSTGLPNTGKDDAASQAVLSPFNRPWSRHQPFLAAKGHTYSGSPSGGPFAPGDIMPNRICPCGFSVPKGQRCACQQQRAKQRQQADDAKRGNSAARGYDADWSKLRFRYLHRHPSCVVCGAPATHVDHIQSVRETPHLRLVESNLRSMCGPCHSRRTARDQSQNWGR